MKKTFAWVDWFQMKIWQLQYRNNILNRNPSRIRTRQLIIYSIPASFSNDWKTIGSKKFLPFEKTTMDDTFVGIVALIGAIMIVPFMVIYCEFVTYKKCREKSSNRFWKYAEMLIDDERHSHLAQTAAIFHHLQFLCKENV